MLIPPSHPRYLSLLIRERLVEGFRRGIVVPEGLIAHGRGEAFDYILGERTWPPALRAVEAAAATLLLARNPVISVNGNTGALVAEDIISLAREVNARIEVNLFHRTREREERIRDLLLSLGADEVLGVGEDASATIPELMSERRRVSPRGILVADVVLVPLEDGDRTEALVRMGKKVVAIDINPFSRTAQKANITIVDNVVRAMPNLVRKCAEFKKLSRGDLENIIREYNNKKIIQEIVKIIWDRLAEIAGGGVE
ncbi:4-phosphopantoate--beta-alanine ligase [Candidatus Methanodesulfokora washburnensis]|jgi:4-phosphopantoate--beta-alanine ligase|uniref:4-phosphopantoate--beta-alanine ligase n=1 Tax=Candidatus Methanodesulfokora washburnensis TaxID=2478471 RepID=A0A3R9QKE5_9CREN|nr:4-phosphopantoate--beta-alanine ligase [Candidatus Methanodesulfokores washburnensis]RSN78630.1 phosphopantothenate/pantothenate synthetase [Candidatus Methanodesulfokores washburnensis]